MMDDFHLSTSLRRWKLKTIPSIAIEHCEAVLSEPLPKSQCVGWRISLGTNLISRHKCHLRLTSPPSSVRVHPRSIFVVVGLLALMAALIVPATTWARGLVVEGSQLPWTAEFPGFWFGGTTHSMEHVLTKTVGADRTSEDMRKLLSLMLPEAKQLDALLFHMDTTGTETDTLSSLRVSVISRGGFDRFTDDSVRGAVMEELAQDRLNAYAPGAKVEVVQHRVGATAGRQAYEGTFAVTLPSGGKVYEVLHLVAYDTGLTHRFALKADSAKFQARYADLEAILKSLRYVVEGAQVPWRAELPSGWTGGNARFLETASAATDDEDYRGLLTKMLGEAKMLDAFLLYFDAGEEGVSSLRIEVGELGLNLSETSQRQKIWNGYLESVNKRHPQASKVAVFPEHFANTGERDAYEITFKVMMLNDQQVHYVVHLVPIDNEKTHVFIFRSDSRKFDERYRDMQSILNSLKYSVAGMKRGS
jgi:hypothetical protein